MHPSVAGVLLPVGILRGQNKDISTCVCLSICPSMYLYTCVYIYLLQTMVSTTIPEYKLKLHGVHSSSFLLTYFCSAWVL